MTTTTVPVRPPLADRLRLRLWELRFAAAMEDYPRREGKQIRADLRAALRDDAARVGTRAALRDVGPPRRLAARYFAELDRPRPRWSTGALVGTLLGVGLPLYLALAWSFGALDALEAVGGGTAELTWLGSPVTATSTDDSVALAWTLGWQAVAVAAVLAAVGFVLGARVWRLWAGDPVA
ncbi:hypothetical protein [Cellulomonas telluris]|uniref:hypothetical protein n=1 Tax=Cellulomonas telluris TaxID=2306636 RepID=UPI0010A89C9C|nr:hypothetical protein [Cellulomonas telluris]